MEQKLTESNSAKSQTKPSGCLIFIVAYVLCLIGMYFTTLPPEETKDFTGRVAKEFSVVGIEEMSSLQSREYMVFSLESLQSGKIDLSDITFLLPEKAITIDVGDIHYAEIIENHGEWQLAAFNYSNTRTSTSTYRAYADRIEPVSYKLKSHVGQAFLAIILVIPALIISMMIKVVINWRAKRAERYENM